MRLDAEMARCDSPIHLVPAAAGPLILGGGERDEFHRQKRNYAGRWQAAGLALEEGRPQWTASPSWTKSPPPGARSSRP